MEGARPPEAWWISRICEEFHCTPSQALKEDAGTVLDVMELRAYHAVYRAVTDDDSTDESLAKAGFPDALITQVMENQQRLIDDERQR